MDEGAGQGAVNDVASHAIAPDIALVTAVTVRARRAEFAELLADAMRNGASVGFVLPVDMPAIERFWEGIAADVERGERFVLTIEHARKIVGTVQLAPCAKANGRHRGEVQKLLVHSGAQRAGRARSLMTAVEALAVRQGLSLLLLDTREQSAADTLYRGSGWQSYGRVPDYAADPDGTLAGCTFFYKQLA